MSKSPLASIYPTILVAFLSHLTWACAPSFQSTTTAFELSSKTDLPNDQNPENDNSQGLDLPPISVPPKDPPNSEPWTGLQICSRLNFEGLTWPETLPSSERNAFALALNITGSFEGKGWDQITGNFDGQGISLGIFQQNLGQGSLQPMLIRLHRQDPRIISSTLSPARAESLLSMLSRWDTNFRPHHSIQPTRFIKSNELNPLKFFTSSDVNFFKPDTASVKPNTAGNLADLETYGFNLLDDPDRISPYLPKNFKGRFFSQNTTRNQASVEWAIQNALEGTRLRPEWLNELRVLSLTTAYRSIQFSEAQKIHQRARQLFFDYNKKELRAYLFFLDIVVQNGSIPQVDRTDYAEWLSQNPNSDEETRLFKILELRLRHVRPQWIEDVRARKSTLILGRGFVHQTHRELDREYCTQIKSLALGPVFKPPEVPTLP